MKVTLYMAVTGNGLIAKSNDDTSYISTEEWSAFEDFAKAAGHMIIGRRNYEVMLAGGELESFKDVSVVVVSSHQIEGVTVVESPKKAVEMLENEGAEVAMLSGGAKINASFLKEGLVDEVILDVEPIIFGQGINLVDPSEDFQTKLELTDTQNIGKNTVQLRYKVKKEYA